MLKKLPCIIGRLVLIRFERQGTFCSNSDIF